MTTASHKDLLFAKFQEFDTAQQRADRARSEMHCIIGSFPSGATPEVGTAPMTRSNRPLVITSPQPDVVEAAPPPAEAKPKKTRAKHVSEADIRKAVKLVFDEDLTQKEAEILCNLPPGTLSRRKGKQIMDGYRKEWGTPTSITGQRGARRKDVEKANRYENR